MYNSEPLILALAFYTSFVMSAVLSGFRCAQSILFEIQNATV